LQAYASCEPSQDHPEIPVSVEDHHILPGMLVFADVDVNLYVYLACLPRDRDDIGRQEYDEVRQAQRKVVGASAVRLSAGYGCARPERAFDFLVSDDGRAVAGTGDDKVHVAVVFLLRGFVGDTNVLEKGGETWEKG